MKCTLVCATLATLLLGLTLSASARDVVVPAGTLLQCTLNEPNFSPATAAVGDPVLCHLRGLTEFGQQAFPRGAYLVGHLEADKEPGHFVGKGYLKLSFDRIGLADTDLPLPAKVISVKGYRVDKEGKIIGHGHATRDVVEWMLPPLWPWKVLTLPARGPRPALKGETYITLRLMDDVVVPLGGPSPGRLGEPGAALTPAPVPSAPAATQSYIAPAAAPPVENQEGLADRLMAATHRPTATMLPATLVRPTIAPPPAPAANHAGWHHF